VMSATADSNFKREIRVFMLPPCTPGSASL
jgi:hypothetical protein